MEAGDDMTSSPGTLADTPPHARRPGETIFAWTIFPLVLLGAVALSIYLLERGAVPVVAYLVPGALGFALVIAGERLHPHVEDWNRSHDDVATDAAWGLTTIASGPLLGPITAAVAIPLGALLSATFGAGLWPSGWHLAAQLVLALVVVEFFQYWVHRLQHEVDLLWRFHAVHHSAPRLYWLNAARFHWVDIGLNNLGYTIPLVALGAEGPVLALWVLTSSLHGICQHANMKIRCGPLNYVFSMAELHRWHHSRTVLESNTNYGQTLILWDLVFRTRFLPQDREPPADIGIADLPDFPMTWWQQMLAPFRWSRIVAGRTAPSSTG